MNKAERTALYPILTEYLELGGTNRYATVLKERIERDEKPAVAKKAPKRKQDPPELRAAKEAVRRRSGGYCEARTAACTGQAEHAHHRKMRSAGGTHSVANLLDACHPCHDWIHAHPEESYERGLLLHSWELEGPLS